MSPSGAHRWPADAAAVRAFCADLGVPGVVDCHVHVLPPPVEAKVWEQFDSAGPKIGRAWPIRYRAGVAERTAFLRDAGVRAWPTLPYAHRPGIAPFLNAWSAQYAATEPEVLRSATFYPEPDAATYVVAADTGSDGHAPVAMWKVHVQVGEFDLDDPLLDDVWGHLEQSGTPVMLHAGSGPVGNAYTGPEATARVLARWPRLRLVLAHLGAPEHAGFLALAERYERVHLDTSMALSPFFAAESPYPPDLVPRLVDLGPRVLFGSDFPTLPFAYADQLTALARLHDDGAWLRGVVHDHAAALLGGSAGLADSEA